jgi:hypothetical protein
LTLSIVMTLKWDGSPDFQQGLGGHSYFTHKCHGLGVQV